MNCSDILGCLKAYVSEKILNRHCLSLSLSADLCIHFYWLSQLRQASHRKMIQSSALRLRLWLCHLKMSSDNQAFRARGGGVGENWWHYLWTAPQYRICLISSIIPGWMMCVLNIGHGHCSIGDPVVDDCVHGNCHRIASQHLHKVQGGQRWKEQSQNI